MSAPVIIVGAGGHARVVTDALLARGTRVLGFTEANPARHRTEVLGLPVLGDDSVLVRYKPDEVRLVNGIGGVGRRGDTSARRTAQRRFVESGWQFATVVHPDAIVSPHAHLGGGVHVLAGAIVQPGARIGDGCIVNTGAIAEHDVVLGAFTHLAPGAVVCGDVVIGTDSHIGAGAVVRQGLRLGASTVVGAGAVVVKDCEGLCLLIGVPARVLEHGR